MSSNLLLQMSKSITRSVLLLIEERLSSCNCYVKIITLMVRIGLGSNLIKLDRRILLMLLLNS